ncbi:hypothetical protein MRS44_007855 [Fusarium solani]|uniref:uncharacterized protein n=1 Tax=Fusarium solani TaxID=169388 RepID=UPI0032C43FB0|nr:hypothetical protein MRS44_007855 [Fusarium solani]
MTSLAEPIGGVWLGHPRSSWQLRVDHSKDAAGHGPQRKTLCTSRPTALGEVVDDEGDGMADPSLAHRPRAKKPTGGAAKLNG